MKIADIDRRTQPEQITNLCERYYVYFFLWDLLTPASKRIHYRISEGFSSNVVNRKLLPTLHATSKIESVVNVSDLSSKELVMRCDKMLILGLT